MSVENPEAVSDEASGAAQFEEDFGDGSLYGSIHDGWYPEQEEDSYYPEDGY